MKPFAQNQDHGRSMREVDPRLSLDDQASTGDWLLSLDADPALLVNEALAAALLTLPTQRQPQALQRLCEEMVHHLCHAPPAADRVADLATRARIAALLVTACHTLSNGRPVPLAP